jgi:MFS family permease
MFFVMKAQGIFSGRLSVAAPILLYVLFNVVYSALAVPLGSISDRIGREKVIIFGYICFSVTAAGFALLSSLTAYTALFALYGVVHAAIDGNQRAYVADLAREHLKATAIGTFHTATGLAALPGGLLAGLLWERFSPQATFIYGGILGLLAVLLFIIFARRFRAVLTQVGANRSTVRMQVCSSGLSLRPDGLLNQPSSSENKKGEVVGPAGGETGEPHCLAEVYMLLRAA